VGPNTSVTQSEKRLLVTQALWLERHKTPRQLFLMFLKALAQKVSVSQSIIGLQPGKMVSSSVIYDQFGILFQKRPLSLHLNTCCETFSLFNYYLKTHDVAQQHPYLHQQPHNIV
jgi:hypothetical protein